MEFHTETYLKYAMDRNDSLMGTYVDLRARIFINIIRCEKMGNPAHCDS